MDQLLQSMVVPEIPSGSMNDATKRRKDLHEELLNLILIQIGMKLRIQPRMIPPWMAKLGM